MSSIYIPDWWEEHVNRLYWRGNKELLYIPDKSTVEEIIGWKPKKDWSWETCWEVPKEVFEYIWLDSYQIKANYPHIHFFKAYDPKFGSCPSQIEGFVMEYSPPYVMRTEQFLKYYSKFAGTDK